MIIITHLFVSSRISESIHFCCCQLNEDMTPLDVGVNHSHLSVCKQCVPSQVDSTIEMGFSAWKRNCYKSADKAGMYWLLIFEEESPDIILQNSTHNEPIPKKCSLAILCNDISEIKHKKIS